MPLPGGLQRPQQFDSVARTVTASVLALVLVGCTCYLAVTARAGGDLTPIQAGVFGLASSIVGFYFGGHVAQNTAAVEEARQVQATRAGEASAVRSEASALRSEASSQRGHDDTSGTGE